MKEQKPRGRKPTPKIARIERFRKLVDNESERGISRQKIADAIGCDVSTITKHYNGYQAIDIEFLYKYAKYFNVSSDYLLGLSDVSSADPDDRAICEKFGLNQKDFDLLVNAFNHREEIADAVIEIRELMKSAEYLRDMLCFENASRRENEKRVST